jgi:hypothetical protein
MATKRKTTGKVKIKANKLKVRKQKVEELTDSDAKKVRGGLASTSYRPATSKI